MTTTWRQGECWDERDAAPMGVPFNIEVASASRPGRVYRLAREHRGDGDGVLVHSPPCERWEHGHRHCRHVTRAIALAERPEETFFADVRELRHTIPGPTTDARERREVVTWRLQDDALNRLEALADYERRMAEVSRREAIRALMTEAEWDAYQGHLADWSLAVFG